jgi:hypothetical protein
MTTPFARCGRKYYQVIKQLILNIMLKKKKQGKRNLQKNSSGRTGLSPGPWKAFKKERSNCRSAMHLHDIIFVGNGIRIAHVAVFVGRAAAIVADELRIK